MAEFVRAQIFGTTFEITSRLVTTADEFWGYAEENIQICGSTTRGNGRLRPCLVCS
jgi:hypothetical protein